MSAKSVSPNQVCGVQEGFAVASDFRCSEIKARQPGTLLLSQSTFDIEAWHTQVDHNIMTHKSQHARPMCTTSTYHLVSYKIAMQARTKAHANRRKSKANAGQSCHDYIPQESTRNTC